MLFWTLRKLRSANPAARVAAAKQLGKSYHADAVVPLIAALSDARPEVRAAVSETLAAPYNPAYALDFPTIGRLGEITPALIAAFADGDACVRAAAMRATARVLDYLLSGMRVRPDPLGIFFVALRSSVHDPVLQAMKDPEPEVRMAATAAGCALCKQYPLLMAREYAGLGTPEQAMLGHMLEPVPTDVMQEALLSAADDPHDGVQKAAYEASRALSMDAADVKGWPAMKATMDLRRPR